MNSLLNFSARLFFVTTLLTGQSAFALEKSDKSANFAIRALADKTANQLEQNQIEAVYASMSPKLKLAYSHEELMTPAWTMQKAFGRIKSYEFEAINYGNRGVGSEWIKVATYWYHAKTDKYPSGTYLKVEVTQEQGHYYVAGYSMERVLFGGKLPFLKH